MSNLNESTVEDAALDYFAQLGYQTAWGPNLAPGEPGEERTSFEQVYLNARLRSAVRRINPGIDGGLIDEAVKHLGRAESQNLVAENFRVHKLITEGVPVEHRGADGAVRTIRIWLIDYN
jgi:type I restriction enzyme R subunit